MPLLAGREGIERDAALLQLLVFISWLSQYEVLLCNVIHCASDCIFAVSMAQLQLLLDQRNCWQQSIKLELFQGSKDIFRDTAPVNASRKQEFEVEKDAITPVPLYEFELRELLYEATMKSGCKWWCRKSQASRASQNVTPSLWTIRFVCRHSKKYYQKQQKDNSRVSRHLLQCGCLASCQMKAISVRMNVTMFPFLIVL